jgi:hypothetical protein
VARPGYRAVLGKESRETLVRILDLSARKGFAVGFPVDIAAVDPPFSEFRVTRPMLPENRIFLSFELDYPDCFCNCEEVNGKDSADRLSKFGIPTG